MQKTVRVPAKHKGLHDITSLISTTIQSTGVSDGLATVFIQHTSASLIIQENADPAVLSDLENWLDDAVPESDDYEHQEEGPDDMPAHVKGAITNTHLSIPIIDGKLALGVWQGIFLWEHRTQARERSLIIHVSE